MKTLIEVSKTIINDKGNATELRQRLKPSGEIWWLVGGQWQHFSKLASGISCRQWIDGKLSDGWALVP